MRMMLITSSLRNHSSEFVSEWNLAALLITSIVLVVFTSCGGGAGSATKPPPPSVAPTITTQPASQTMLLGRTATFSVTASGTAPLVYQWYKNGAAVSEANSATFTTPVVTTADNNTTYSVTVSNSAGSITSSTATLLAGPRAPAIGDLRYLQWEQVPLYSEIGSQYGGIASFFGSQDSQSSPNALGLPVAVGTYALTTPGLCEWPMQTTGIAPDTGTIPMLLSYSPGKIGASSGQTYAQYLQSIAAANTVVFSMDLEPSCQLIGVAILSTSQTTEPAFDQRMELVSPSNLQSQVAADGAASRIVTAVTFDSSVGKYVLLSYGWQGDTTTAYEAMTMIAQPANVLADAELLANQGYFSSAFGGNDQSGNALVGMRVMGDTIPRPWYAALSAGGSSGTNTTTSGNIPSILDPAPFSSVLWLYENFTASSPTTTYFFDEQ